MPALVSQAIGRGLCTNSPPGPTAAWRGWKQASGGRLQLAEPWGPEAWRSPGPVSRREARQQPSEPPLCSPGRRRPGAGPLCPPAFRAKHWWRAVCCCPRPRPRSSVGAHRAATMLLAHLEQQPWQQLDNWCDWCLPQFPGPRTDRSRVQPMAWPEPTLSPPRPLVLRKWGPALCAGLSFPHLGIAAGLPKPVRAGQMAVPTAPGASPPGGKAWAGGELEPRSGPFGTCALASFHARPFLCLWPSPLATLIARLAFSYSACLPGPGCTQQNGQVWEMLRLGPSSCCCSSRAPGPRPRRGLF